MPIGAALASHPVVVGDGGGSTKRTQHAKLRVGDEERSAVRRCRIRQRQPELHYRYLVSILQFSEPRLRARAARVQRSAPVVTRIQRKIQGSLEVSVSSQRACDLMIGRVYIE